MAKIREAGAAFNLLNALWAGYISLAAMNRPIPCPDGGCPVSLLTSLPTVLLAAAVILVIDSIGCFIGLRLAFLAGAVLSLVIAGLVVVQWSAYGYFGSTIALVLSAGALILDILSMRSGMRIPEESHPLNLPVFG